MISCEFTGFGFYTSYLVYPKYKDKTVDNAMLVEINAGINDLKHGTGFILSVSNGLTDMLEGYAYDENFPPCITQYILY